MKYILFFHVCLILCITYSCHLERSNDPVQEFIPGTYIRFSQHEFGTEQDTLIITMQNASAKTYSITRRWKYERILNGVLIEPEYKLTVTSGSYEPKHKLLRENETGDIISFDVHEECLFNGPVKYQKI